MNTEIYYFTGTGNSLFAAKELKKRIPGAELLPVVPLLKEEKVKSRGRVVGFVFPVHALTIPVVMSRFLKKIDLSEAEYIFAVATRYGTVFHGFKKMDRLLKKQRKRLDAGFVIDMCNNDTRHGKYTVPSKEEILAIENRTLERLDGAAEIILERNSHSENIKEHRIKSASNPVSAFLTERLVTALIGLSEYGKGVNYFYHDDKCTGCGICKKICPSRKISIADGRPVWDRNTFCYMCFACLNFCPAEAVQIHDIPGVKSDSKENGRYPHPYATVSDMLLQKGE